MRDQPTTRRLRRLLLETGQSALAAKAIQHSLASWPVAHLGRRPSVGGSPAAGPSEVCDGVGTATSASALRNHFSDANKRISPIMPFATSPRCRQCFASDEEFAAALVTHFRRRGHLGTLWAHVLKGLAEAKVTPSQSGDGTHARAC